MRKKEIRKSNLKADQIYPRHYAYVSNSFVSRMIANGYIVYKRSRCFFKLRLLFALVSVCICICIPIESSLLHICIQIRRGQWEIDMGRI